MMCSGDEIGIPTSVDGLLILDPELEALMDYSMVSCKMNTGINLALAHHPGFLRFCMNTAKIIYAERYNQCLNG